MNKFKHFNILAIILFLIFIGLSYFFEYDKGEESAKAFFYILTEMLKILPCAFILIGLFETWIKKETVIKYLGNESGYKGYLWVLILAGFTVGGLYVAFPLAETLRKKGASLKIIFTYLGFAGIVRIPMTIFEITFLGLPFTLVRLFVTIPLFLVMGIFLGSILTNRKYKLMNE